MKNKILFVGIFFFIFIIVNMFGVVRSDYNSTMGGTNYTLCGNGICNNGDNCSGNSCFSNAGVEYGTDILNDFKSQSEVRIYVELKDNSGIVINGTTEERKALLNQIDSWFQPEINNILNNLSNNEFQLANKFTDGFSGYISQE